MRRYLLPLATLLYSGALLGQSIGTLSGPSFAYIFDKNAAAVRPLLGIPGSATIGPPIDLGFPIVNSVSLPGQRVLVAPATGAYWQVANPGASPPTSQTINGADKSAAIALSPSGTSAALAVQSRKMVQVITGLPDFPTLSPELSTESIQGAMQRAVVNDAGNLLVVSFLEDDHETLYRWNKDEGFRFLATVRSVGALSFLRDTDIAYADRGTGEVFLARDVKTQSVVQFVAGAGDGVSGPIGLTVSETGGFFLANSGTGTVMTFDGAGILAQTRQCNCELAGIFPLASGIFRLTDGIDRTIQLLDDGSREKRIIFVPPLR